MRSIDTSFEREPLVETVDARAVCDHLLARNGYRFHPPRVDVPSCHAKTKHHGLQPEHTNVPSCGGLCAPKHRATEGVVGAEGGAIGVREGDQPVVPGRVISRLRLRAEAELASDTGHAGEPMW